MEPFGYVFHNGTNGDDGNRVIRGADIDKARECGDAKFSSSCCFNVMRKCLDDEIDATIVSDDFEHATSKDGDDDEFRHTHDAIIHGCKPSKNVVCTDGNANDACEQDAYSKCEQHVYTTNGEDYNNNIWYNEPNVDGIDVCG